jgi:hypothetical protein
MLAGTLHAPAAFFIFFNCTKSKIPPRPINNHKYTMSKITKKSLNARLKIWNGMVNVVIPLFDQT